MASFDHDDLVDIAHPMQPYPNRIPPHQLSQPEIVDAAGKPVTYRPTLPPVAHDPLNMQEKIDLLSLYPKLADVAAIEAAIWGNEIKDPIERSLRRGLFEAKNQAMNALNKIQEAMGQQRDAQAAFNRAYNDVEAILAKFPELLKP